MSGTRAFCRRRTLPFVLGLLFVCAAGAQTPAVSPWIELEKEADPVRRARRLPKLGEAELNRISTLANADKFDESLAALQDYRDAVRRTHQALKATRVNAEKKPGGFKHLEMHLRKSLRDLTDIIASLPFERRAPFQAIHKELETIDRELLDLLFPRQPGRRIEGERRKG